jgi:protein disulfide-isomerase
MKNLCGIEELDEFILENIKNKLVICIYFGAKWCGPCNQLKNKLLDPEIIESMPKLIVGYLDIDNDLNNDLIDKYNIVSLPTQVFIKLDKNKVIPVSKIEGYDFEKFKFYYDDYTCN